MERGGGVFHPLQMIRPPMRVFGVALLQLTLRLRLPFAQVIRYQAHAVPVASQLGIRQGLVESAFLGGQARRLVAEAMDGRCLFLGGRFGFCRPP
ncbi:MAG: hypothetical protein M2R45_03740 [Verrucomicrobia subdivision 3 bacterium]|nr:hypothetical protein [Limisphaerales bacterium]MCS1416937.1 hypothetical protein [Limisphaerales bacterium]